MSIFNATHYPKTSNHLERNLVTKITVSLVFLEKTS